MEVFPELSRNPIGEPQAILPSSSSAISHTNTPPTTHRTLSSSSHTANCHTYSHTTDHPHHTNTTTPTTTSITTFTSIIYPKQPRLNKSKNPTHTTSTTTTSTTKHLRSKKRKSTQITIPKRHPPTLSPFISTKIRLKQHKKYPLPFTHHRTSLTTHPTTSSIPSTTSTTKTPPNILISTNTPTSTTPTQSTSTTPTHNSLNTLTTITNTTPPAATTDTATINTTTTTTTTQTQIPSLMELNVSLPPRLYTPSTSLTIPLSLSSPPPLPPHFYP